MNDAWGRSCSFDTSSWLQMISLTLISISSGDMASSLYAGVDSPERPLHQHPAVDSQNLAGDVPRFGASQECRGVADVVGATDLAQWDLLDQLGALRLGQVLGGHVGGDVARRDRVARDAARRELARGRQGQADQAGLRGRVADLARVAHLAD